MLPSEQAAMVRGLVDRIAAGDLDAWLAPIYKAIGERFRVRQQDPPREEWLGGVDSHVTPSESASGWSGAVVPVLPRGHPHGLAERSPTD